MRNKSFVLCEDGAEQGSVEVGEAGFPGNRRGHTAFISQTQDLYMEPSLVISDDGEARNTADPVSPMPDGLN